MCFMRRWSESFERTDPKGVLSGEFAAWLENVAASWSEDDLRKPLGLCLSDGSMLYFQHLEKKSC